MKYNIAFRQSLVTWLSIVPLFPQLKTLMTRININRLTAEQETLMSVIRDEWIKIAFDTSPVNQEKAEAAINLTYKIAQGSQPKKIVWFDNPLDAAIWILENLHELNKPKYFSVIPEYTYWDDVLNNIYNCVHPNISSKFEHNFNKVINCKYLHWTSQCFLSDFVDYHLRLYLHNLWGEEKYLTRLGDFEDVDDAEVHGMHDIYHLAAASFYSALGIDCSKLRGYWEAAKYCGLWWAFADIAVVTPKPSVINLDSEYRLHAEGKPAVVYRGFESYVHHGNFNEQIFKAVTLA